MRLTIVAIALLLSGCSTLQSVDSFNDAVAVLDISRNQVAETATDMGKDDGISGDKARAIYNKLKAVDRYRDAAVAAEQAGDVSEAEDMLGKAREALEAARALVQEISR